ncbi:MAG: aminotransferase class I/II-fold pyridoxal phosphate-dependent enzyme, partial [Planctomycetota bacterium]|nr:aminotransferase class I/II-fold pyridoxal phosphate-dependent enzyme [Planctomycetota bacterium]
GNPSRQRLEQLVASLEGGVGGLAYSSGMAATHGAMMLLKQGDHVIAGADIYGGTYRLLHKVLNQAGIEVSLVDTRQIDRLDQAVRDNTRMLWLESPGNPLMSITDLEQCCRWAKSRKILVGVDNTFATPVLTRPLEFGAEIVMHSATKYLGGHSDALGGVLVTSQTEILERLHFFQNAVGNVMSPWDAYLIGRGIKTLELRVREQSSTALRLAEFLSQHPRVRSVNYPGLEQHPGHEVARRQMDGAFGAMISFEAGDDFSQAKTMVESTGLFQLAVSLGAVESLIEQPASMSHAAYDREDRLAHGITDSLVRISVGLESFDDLKADLSQALDSMD